MRIQKKAATSSVEGSARLLKAMADPVRLRLLNLLAGHEVCVCHLHDALNLPQPTVSRHLAYLRKTGLVVGRKDGLWVHYRMAEPLTDLHRTLVDAVVPCLADLASLKADRERLAGLSCC
ncbi:MAG: putative transcriptional regulator [Planctomycetota bacterium]|nr:putative transcriptional regulator [Planctomycetota bacterium]